MLRNGQQQRASCFPTLLRNDLNLSDVVHFTSPDSNLSCNKSGFRKLCPVDTDFRLDKITRELRQTRALRHKIGLPCGRENACTNFVSKSKILNSVLSAKTSFVASHVCWFVGGKTHNINCESTRFAAMLQNELHVSVARFTVPLRLMKLKTFLESSQLESHEVQKTPS